ncbi:hypothetical protein [Microbacterium sp.]|uniref:hypothetical protein n=1 Tax=Microbacterium sp. TaxID=51671 RepID=UPI0026300F66|nr:hypothetical protein [Microbacterium sp.]
MPEWVSEWVSVIQLLLNAGALIGGAVVWKLYVDNLKAVSEVKDATLEAAEKSRDFWKDKAQELEKRSPEVMEKVLEERIQIRDGEVARLKADKEFDAIAVRALEKDKAELEQDLFRAQGFRAMLALEDEAYGEDSPSIESGDDLDETDVPPQIEVDLIGEVAVDSGQLMVTDPCYIDSEWRREPFAVEGPVERTEDTVFNYSYDGACRSTLSGGGHGELGFAKGHAGAGVAFGTAWGDGMYPVFAEKHDGRIVRVYVNVG